MDELLGAAVRLAIIIVSIVLTPVLIVISTPFVLLWPRGGNTDSYARVVFRRYGKVARLCFNWLDAWLI